MRRISRDSLVAVFLLVFCGVFFWASTQIEEMGYATIGSEVWPQLILLVLFVLSAIYLFQSVRRKSDDAGEGGGLKGWFHRYKNALWCYLLFFLFLITLPWLGMLIGATLFVFLTLSALGRHTFRDHLLHGAIAIGTISFMWALFTFGLRVVLPAGEVLSMF